MARGTWTTRTRRKVRTAGGLTALTAGVTSIGFGILSSPAAADSIELQYECSNSIGEEPLDGGLTVTIRGDVPETVEVGESLDLTGFQVVTTFDETTIAALQELDVADFEGEYTNVTLDIAQGDGDEAFNAVGDGLSIPRTSVEENTTFTVPPEALTLGPFIAELVGPVTFNAGHLEADLNFFDENGDPISQGALDCDPAAGQNLAVTSVEIVEPSTPPTTSPPATSEPPPTTTEPAPSSSAPSPTATSPSTSAAPSVSPTVSAAPSTSAAPLPVGDNDGGDLATTGFDNAIPLTAGGIALVGLGAWLTFARRHKQPNEG